MYSKIFFECCFLQWIDKIELLLATIYSVHQGQCLKNARPWNLEKDFLEDLPKASYSRQWQQAYLTKSFFCLLMTLKLYFYPIWFYKSMIDVNLLWWSCGFNLLIPVIWCNMGQSIQEWTSKICGRHPLKNVNFKFFKG